MSATPAIVRLRSALAAGAEPGVYRFRVFYLQVNGRRRVVAAWRLRETIRSLKLMHMYTRIAQLEDSAAIEFSATVHGCPLDVLVSAGTWEVRHGR